MATTFLTLTNELLRRLNEVTLTTDTFATAKNVQAIAKDAIKIGAKVLWLQFGIQNDEAKEIAKLGNMTYVANRCIKQEYQRMFLKINPVFPALLGTD